MCARYALHRVSFADREFQVNDPAWTLEARYNVAPHHSVPVVRTQSGEREGLMMRWGLIPQFCCGAPPAYSTINARLEVIETAASFRGAWHRRQRCLQLACGFYEWHLDAAGHKVPYFIHLEDQETFAFAGLWDRTACPDGSVIQSVTLVTIPANELLRDIHNCGSTPYRMPAILRKEDQQIWLTGTPEQARAILTPYASERMSAYEVSARVNLIANDDEHLLEPVNRPS
jgi:putative SOS response-associated peptidase YedK